MPNLMKADQKCFNNFKVVFLRTYSTFSGCEKSGNSIWKGKNEIYFWYSLTSVGRC
jgi:hypothetical protein